MKGIEKSFLDNWASWDEIDCGDLQFNDIVINAETKGSMLCSLTKEQVNSIQCMAFFGQTSKVEFYDNEGEPVYTRDVKLVFTD